VSHCAKGKSPWTPGPRSLLHSFSRQNFAGSDALLVIDEEVRLANFEPVRGFEDVTDCIEDLSDDLPIRKAGAALLYKARVAALKRTATLVSRNFLTG
jgi:hypothetical protein